MLRQEKSTRWIYDIAFSWLHWQLIFKIFKHWVETFYLKHKTLQLSSKYFLLFISIDLYTWLVWNLNMTWKWFEVAVHALWKEKNSLICSQNSELMLNWWHCISTMQVILPMIWVYRSSHQQRSSSLRILMVSIELMLMDRVIGLMTIRLVENLFVIIKENSSKTSTATWAKLM